MDTPDLDFSVVEATINSLKGAKEQALPALKILMKYFSNLINNMQEPKFFRISKKNKIFGEKVSCSKEALQLLEATGFIESEDFWELPFPQNDYETERKFRIVEYAHRNAAVLISSVEGHLYEGKIDGTLYATVAQSTNEMYQTQLRELKLNMLTEKLSVINDLGATRPETTAIGVLVGGAIGDALGTPFCGLSPGQIQEQCGGAIIVNSFHQTQGRTGCYSWVTSLSVCLSQSILSSSTLEIEDIHTRITKCIVDDTNDRVCDSTLKDFLRSSHASPPLPAPSDSYCCMLSIIGYFLRNASEWSVRQAVQATLSPFHADTDALDGGLLYSLAIQELIGLSDASAFKPNQFLKNLISSARTPKARNKLIVLHQVMEKSFMSGSTHSDDSPFLIEVYPEPSRHCWDALVIALWFFIRYHQKPSLGLCLAVSFGGQTNIIGSMVGSLFGALCGTAWIPKEWFALLESVETLVGLGKQLSPLALDQYQLPPGCFSDK